MPCAPKKPDILRRAKLGPSRKRTMSPKGWIAAVAVPVALIIGLLAATWRAEPMPAVAGSKRPPRDLNEALQRMESSLPPKIVEEIRRIDERDMGKYSAVGDAWSWPGLDGVAQHLCGLGLPHNEDTTGRVLRLLWRRIHGQPLQVEQLVQEWNDALSEGREWLRAAHAEVWPLIFSTSCPVRDWLGPTLP